VGLSTLNGAFTLLGRFIDTHQAVKPIYPDTSDKPLYHFSSISQPLPRVRPEDEGIDSSLLSRFLLELYEDETLNMHSIMILRNGSVLAEATFGEQDLRVWKSTFSACKTITGMAIGFLEAEGKVRTDDRIVDLFEDRITPLQKLSLKDLTVHHLLTMTSGAVFNELAVMTERDWIKGFFGNPFTTGPFFYNSLNSYILSAIVERKTGMSLSSYLKPRLFDPLGIENYYWEKCPMGIEKGGWGLYMRPEDMAKLGVLVMENGVWHGKRILSAEWLAKAGSKQVDTGAVSAYYDYGYQMWTGRNHDSFLFNGMLGQNVIGFRESGVILVSNAGNNEFFHQSNYFPLAEKYFGSEKCLGIRGGDASGAELKKTLSTLRTPPYAIAEKPRTENKKKIFGFTLFKKDNKESPVPLLPRQCAVLNGITFTAEGDNAPSVGLMPVVLQGVQNNYTSGFTSLSFLQNGSQFHITYSENEETHLLLVGFGSPAESILTFHGIPYHVKTSGVFTKNEDGVPLLKVRIAFVETPLTRYIKLYYTGKHPYMEQYETPGGDFIYDLIKEIKGGLESTPLIGTTIKGVDNDYLRYRIDKKFAPILRLTSAKIISRKSVE